MEDHNKTTKDQLQAVWFAAGVAVVIACVERAVVVSIFKQWHMWVFLALNLLLIAILFTSTHPPRNCSNPPTKSNAVQDSDKKQPREDAVDDGVSGVNVSEEREEGCFAGEDEEDDEEEDEKSSSVLSNEELNERVEAFISRFRQQYLVSEVKIGRRRSDDVCGGVVFSKTITV